MITNSDNDLEPAASVTLEIGIEDSEAAAAAGYINYPPWINKDRSAARRRLAPGTKSSR